MTANPMFAFMEERMTKGPVDLATLRAAAIEMRLNPDTCSVSDVFIALIDKVAELRENWHEEVQEHAAAHARATELEGVLTALVNKLTEIEVSPEYQGVWGLYHAHGGRYSGPQYAEELDAARAALKVGL